MQVKSDDLRSLTVQFDFVYKKCSVTGVVILV